MLEIAPPFRIVVSRLLLSWAREAGDDLGGDVTTDETTGHVEAEGVEGVHARALLPGAIAAPPALATVEKGEITGEDEAMSLADATASVAQQIFARMIRDGLLPRGVVENIAAGYDMMADETLIADKKADAMMAADVARMILVLSNSTVTKPVLRLVPDEPPSDE